jgi:hypothetical protein
VAVAVLAACCVLFGVTHAPLGHRAALYGPGLPLRRFSWCFGSAPSRLTGFAYLPGLTPTDSSRQSTY